MEGGDNDGMAVWLEVLRRDLERIKAAVDSTGIWWQRSAVQGAYAEIAPKAESWMRGIQKAFGITELRVEEDLLTHTEHEVSSTMTNVCHYAKASVVTTKVVKNGVYTGSQS